MRNNNFISIFLISITVSACASKSISLTPQITSNQCGIGKPVSSYIKSYEELNNVYKPSFNNPLKSIKPENFDNNAFILIALGQKPTTGFSIKLLDKSAKLEGSTLNINYSLVQPDKQSLNAQVITSPCVLYKTEIIGLNNIVVKKQ